MTCGMEESGGKFPPLLNNWVNENQKRREKKRKKRKKREKKGNKEKMGKRDMWNGGGKWGEVSPTFDQSC